MRKQFQQISILALAVVFLAGCGAAVNPQEQLATKIMASMDDVANIFSTIKDEKSAEAAKVKIMQDKMMEFAKVAMTNPKIMEIIGPVMQKMGSPK